MIWTILRPALLNLLIVIMSLVSWLPIPPMGMVGAYNTWSHQIYCETEDVCIHEQGHKLDQSLGYPSQTVEFSLALTEYTVSQFKGASPDDLAVKIMNTLMTSKQNPYREVYADIYKRCNGDVDNIPDILKEFYE